MFLVGMASHAQSTQSCKLCKIFAIPEERSEGWSWLFVQVNIKVLYKLILSYLLVVAWYAYAESTQNNKYYAISQEVSKW